MPTQSNPKPVTISITTKPAASTTVLNFNSIHSTISCRKGSLPCPAHLITHCHQCLSIHHHIQFQKLNSLPYQQQSPAIPNHQEPMLFHRAQASHLHDNLQVLDHFKLTITTIGITASQMPKVWAPMIHHNHHEPSPLHRRGASSLSTTVSVAIDPRSASSSSICRRSSMGI
jgi:hypothetical protein